MNINQKDIGLRIRERRKAIGMTQEELAYILGYYGNEKISKIENGKVNNICDLNILTEFAETLGVSVNYLTGEINNEDKFYIKSFYENCSCEDYEYDIKENGDLYIITKAINGKNIEPITEHIVNKESIYQDEIIFNKGKERHRYKHDDFSFNINLYNADYKTEINYIDIKILKNKTLIGRYRGYHIPAGKYRQNFFDLFSYLDCQDSILNDMWLVIDEYAKYKDKYDIVLSRDLYVKKEYQNYNLHDFIRKDIYKIIQEEFIECVCLNSYEEEYETHGNLDKMIEVSTKYKYQIVKDFANDTTFCIFGLYYSDTPYYNFLNMR